MKAVLPRQRSDVLEAAGVPLTPTTDLCIYPLLRTKPRKDGYWDVFFEGRNTYLHRLILELNEGDIVLPSAIQARHTCGNKPCVNRRHIVPGSIGQNMADQYVLGERVMNERHPNCRLSTTDAKAIRNSPSTVSSQELARQYGITRSYVNQIRAGTRRQFIETGAHETRATQTQVKGNNAMSATTFGTALAKIGVSLPGHLVADVEVPVLTGVQLQGDLAIIPATTDSFDVSHVKLGAVPDAGIQVVRGEGTGNTHWLHRGFESPGVTWARVDNHELILGVVHVPEGETAELIHTDEHGCNAMGPGTYVIHGKREQADEIRRVQD